MRACLLKALKRILKVGKEDDLMFSNRCAKCHQGKIFRYFMMMNDSCSECGHQFEREEGFFLGAMILSYFLSTLLALPVLLLTVFKYDLEFPVALLIAAAVMLVTSPVIYRYSKLVWIHVEEKIYESFQAKRDEAKPFIKAS